MPKKYAIEYENTVWTDSTGDATINVKLNLPTGFYPSIHIYANVQGEVRGAFRCELQNRERDKVFAHFPAIQEEIGLDSGHWHVYNTFIDESVNFVVRYSQIVLGDELSIGFFATRERSFG